MWLRHRRQLKRVNLRVIKKTISPVRESPRFIWYQTFEHRYIQCFTTFLRNWTIRHDPRRLNWDQNFQNKIQKWMFFSNFSVYDVWISFHAFLFCYCLLLNGHTRIPCVILSAFRRVKGSFLRLMCAFIFDFSPLIIFYTELSTFARPALSSGNQNGMQHNQ